MIMDMALMDGKAMAAGKKMAEAQLK